MSFNTFGKIFRFTTWGESHGPAIGCIVDGCPPNIQIKIEEIQKELNKRKPGQSKFTTQRKEDDKVEILSGMFEGKTTGTPISMIIYNKDMRSKDYGNIKNKFRPGHADFTYFQKYGIRDYRGGGRQSARETASRVAAGAIAKKVLQTKLGKKYNVGPGGKGCNQAIAIARLGGNTNFISKIGKDEYGELALKTLEKNKISKENIIQDYDVDVFSHLWFDEGLQTKPYKYGGSGGWIKQRISDESIDDFIKIYNPKELLVEPSKQFLDSNLSDNYLSSM